MQKSNINLKQISIDDNLDGLEVLKNIAYDETSNNESPVPKEIDENLYKGFLLLCEEETKKEDYCFRYWILLDNKIIGYADIKNPKDKEYKQKVGNIGIVLNKEYRNKGLGLYILKLLVKKAKEEFNMDKILIVTGENNISMRKLIEKVGGNLEDINEKCQYWIK